MCCAHSYIMPVCPIISGQSSETGVRQRSDRGQTEVGGESKRSLETEN